jgi:hypothetical protein
LVTGDPQIRHALDVLFRLGALVPPMSAAGAPS